MKKSILSILTLFLFSCKKETNSVVAEKAPAQEYLDDYNNKVKMSKLVDNLNSCDTISFKQLEKIYFISNHQKEFLFYSLRMATDCEYGKAYHTTYSILATDETNNKNFKINRLANYYLLKAYEKGYKDAKYDIDERFENNKIPSALEYWNMINK